MLRSFSRASLYYHRAHTCQADAGQGGVFSPSPSLWPTRKQTGPRRAAGQAAENMCGPGYPGLGFSAVCDPPKRQKRSLENNARGRPRSCHHVERRSPRAPPKGPQGPKGLIARDVPLASSIVAGAPAADEGAGARGSARSWDRRPGPLGKSHKVQESGASCLSDPPCSPARPVSGPAASRRTPTTDQPEEPHGCSQWRRGDPDAEPGRRVALGLGLLREGVWMWMCAQLLIASGSWDAQGRASVPGSALALGLALKRQEMLPWPS